MCARFILTLLLLSTLPGRALAADPALSSSLSLPSAATVAVHYDAPYGCPTVEAYLTRVEARLGSDWKTAVGQFAEHVEVTITREGDSYRGSIEFVSARGERFSRGVNGEVCSEVVEGISLMTELAVKSRVGEPSTRTDVGSVPAPSTPTEASDRALVVQPTSAASVAPVEPSRRSEPSAQAGFHVRAGVRGSLTTGVGPDISLGAGAFAALELSKARVGIGFDFFDSGEVQANTSRADFRLLSARLEGCPWSLELKPWASLEPCLLGELGSFRAAPRLSPPEVTVSEPTSVFWGALGVLGRVLFQRPPFLVSLEIVGRAPLRRERFFIQTEDRVVFRVPSGSVGAALGLGLRF